MLVLCWPKIVNVLLFPFYPVAQGFQSVTANVFCILLLSHKIYGQREIVELVRAELGCILCTTVRFVFSKVYGFKIVKGKRKCKAKRELGMQKNSRLVS